MTKTIQIKNRHTEEIIYQGQFKTLKECLEQAIKENADLRNANLWNANLRNANLSDAEVFGEKLSKNPIKIVGEKYLIFEAGSKIKIGSQLHSKAEWFNFSDKEIIEMYGKEALIWWKKWKPILQQMFEIKENDRQKSSRL